MAMTKEQLLKSIERAELALGRTDREGAKAVLQKQLDQMKTDLAALEKETAKKEEKIEEKEQAAKEDFDADIAKFEAMLKRNPGAKIREVFEKKLKEAKRKKAEMEAEAKADKAEAKQELQEVKEAVKDIEKAVATGSIEPIKKPKIEEKKRENKSKKRIKTMQQTITSLSALVNRVQELKDKYIQSSGSTSVDLKRDAGRPAKPFGYRFIGKGKNAYRVPTPAEIKLGKKRGTIDYEGRPNHSDVYPKGYKGNVREKLAAGGTLMAKMAKGGITKESIIRTLTSDKSQYFLEKDGSGYILYISPKGSLNSTFMDKFNVEDLGNEGTKRKYKLTKMDGGMMEKGGKAAKKKKAKFDYDEEALTGERAGERRAETGYADGGKIYKYDLRTLVEKKKGGESIIDYNSSVINFSGTERELSDKIDEITKSDRNIAYVQTSRDGKRTKLVMSKYYLSDRLADGGEIEKPMMKKKGAGWVVVYKGDIKEFDDKEDASDYMNDLKDEVKDKQWSKKINRGLGTGYADGGKISKADVETIAKKLKYDINEQDVRAIVKLYPAAQKDAPDDTWNIVVEDLVYKFKEEDDRYKKSLYNPSEAPKKPKMAKGGKLVGKQANLDMNKNGRLDKEDFQILRGKKKKKMAKGGATMRKNSPHRFCWTKDAVKDGIIKPADMNKTPSRYQRKTYAAYIMEK